MAYILEQYHKDGNLNGVLTHSGTWGADTPKVFLRREDAEDFCAQQAQTNEFWRKFDTRIVSYSDRFDAWQVFANPKVLDNE